MYDPTFAHIATTVFAQSSKMGHESEVPQPGPARLSKGAGPDEWLEQAQQCKYLPEADMKRLCEIVKEYLMEGEP